MLSTSQEVLKEAGAEPVTPDARNYAGAKLPIVSFIVVNHNYGRYLRECVDSIFAQTYPFVECIVVDNGSDDDSQTVIKSLASTYPDLKIISEPINLGQSAACIKGFEISRGHFIVLVDADDYYLENFVEAHLLVHLSSSLNPVGFSTSNMLQVADGILLGSYMDIGAAASRQCREVRLCSPPSLRDVFRRTIDSIDLERLPTRLVDRKMTAWVWAPTSGTMYRREALALFADCRYLPSLRYGTDAFFNYAINALTGSILIEKPLAVYRIHGANLFTQRVALRNLISFQKGADKAPIAAKYALIHVVENFSRFGDSLMDNGTLGTALSTYSRKAEEMRFNVALLKLRRKALRLFWKVRTKFLPGESAP